MKIVVCLDFSSFTEQVLAYTRDYVKSLEDVSISVIHIVEETLFYSTSGFEVSIGEEANIQSKQLKELVQQYLGENINYIEEFGVPKQKIPEMLDDMDYDLLIAGSNTHKGFEKFLLGSTSEHLLHEIKKPVLIVP